MSSSVLVRKSKKALETCPRCDNDMIDIQPCHWQCRSCGIERTCEDL